MTVYRIQCSNDADYYAISIEGGFGFFFRPHNLKSEDTQWLKNLDVGMNIDKVCSRFRDQGLYFDLYDCIPLEQLKSDVINVHKLGELR